jgi:hypothetical protein
MPHPMRPVVAALALLASAGLHAEQNPYHFGASLGATHHSNVFQTAAGAQSDTVTSAGLLGGLDLNLGRQHVYATGNVQSNRYSKADQLNNISYGLSAGLDWQTIERLSGNLRYSANQSLVNYADVQFPVGTKDVQKTQQTQAAIRYGIMSNLGLEGSAAHRTVDYSAEEDKRDFRQNVASLGLRWGGTGLLTLGAAVRVTKSDVPNALIVAPVFPPLPPSPAVYGPDRADRRDIDLTGTWAPSGLSTLSLRVSLSRETHTQPSIPTFSGVTGALTWDYRPTGKLSFSTSLIRDTGSETTFAVPASNFIPVRADNDRITNVVDVQAKWEATAKVVVNANLRHSDGSVVNTFGGAGHSSTTSVALGANYAITRSIDLGCNVGYESRANSYNASTVGCSGRFTLR